MTYAMEHLFIHSFAVCISSLVKCLIWSLGHFLIGLLVFLLLSFKSSLYILDNSSLSNMSFANIFSQSVTCLFIPLTLSFTEQKFLILMKSSLSTVSWIVPLVLHLKSHSHTQSYLDFFPILCYISFIILCFTFRSLIHSELIFVMGIKSVPRFIFLHVAVHHYLLKRLSFSIVYFFFKLIFIGV